MKEALTTASIPTIGVRLRKKCLSSMNDWRIGQEIYKCRLWCYLRLHHKACNSSWISKKDLPRIYINIQQAASKRRCHGINEIQTQNQFVLLNASFFCGRSSCVPSSFFVLIHARYLNLLISSATLFKLLYNSYGFIGGIRW